MDFEVIGKTGTKLVVRIDDGNLETSYGLSVVFFGIPIVLLIVGLAISLPRHDPQGTNITILICLIAGAIFVPIGLVFLRMGLIKVTVLTIDKECKFFEIKTRVPRRVERIPIDTIDYFKILHGEDDVNLTGEPIQMQAVLNSGEIIPIYYGMWSEGGTFSFRSGKIVTFIPDQDKMEAIIEELRAYMKNP